MNHSDSLHPTEPSGEAVQRPVIGDHPWAPRPPMTVDEVLDLVNEYSLAFKGERYEAASVILGRIRAAICNLSGG